MRKNAPDFAAQAAGTASGCEASAYKTASGWTHWKVYGPDLNGRFGGMQGTGGLEAVVMDSGGAATGVINDFFGNGVATVSGGAVTWSPTHVAGYGPLPDSTATPLTDATQLAQATVWRGHRIDPTGFYYLGARYYEPTSGRFLSCDPLGFAGSTSLYDFGGDPVNHFDADGRCAEQGTNWWNPSIMGDSNFNFATGATNQPWVTAYGNPAETPASNTSGPALYFIPPGATAAQVSSIIANAYAANGIDVSGAVTFVPPGATSAQMISSLESQYQAAANSSGSIYGVPYDLAQNPNAPGVVGGPNASNSGNDSYGSTLEAIGTAAGFVGDASDAAKQLYGVNASIGTIPITDAVGNITFGVGVVADLGLSLGTNPKTGQQYQSWGETAANTAVGSAAWYVGGPEGMLIGGGYQMAKQGLTQPFIGDTVGPGTPETWANAQYNAQTLQPMNNPYRSF